ncbi:glycosyltransferase [uncultured Prochlorococcus sp.]|uniref:glycosyltransferase n=1 Tax=uncultured Prochlorococcus sp. TaxID=159733 RepID=UPI0025860F92|nr:glycosyltransferase [uncultured Prochlorococcus sp.]
MISSTADIGGGPKQMFTLGENLNSCFNVFYALPKKNSYSNFLNLGNHIEISERKINPKDILNLIKFISINKIDIIHAHGKGAGVLSRITNLFLYKKLVYTFHGIHIECHSYLSNFIYLIYENFFGRIDNHRIFVAESEKLYAKKSKIFFSNNVSVINNGVENKFIKEKKTFLNKHNKLKNIPKINIISVCRFVKQKNIKDIINIAKEIPEVDFQIIGYGRLWKDIEERIVNLAIKNVKLIGMKKNVFEYLYYADVYLSTSLYEGLPLSILEAMSVGLPVIASNVVGNIDTVENGISGYLYDLKDLSIAVKYIKKLAKDEELRYSMGYNSFKRQRKFFSKEKMILKYENLYKRIYQEI